MKYGKPLMGEPQVVFLGMVARSWIYEEPNLMRPYRMDIWKQRREIFTSSTSPATGRFRNKHTVKLNQSCLGIAIVISREQ